MVAGSPGVVDAHFHVIAPPHRFSMLAARSYTPAPSSLSDWRDRLLSSGVTRGVLVQPSIYGTDNRLLVATLAEAQGQLVGVAAVHDDIDDVALDALVAAGVRGVRMAHFEAGDPRSRGGLVPLSHFERLEDRLAERGLHLQLFTDSMLLPCIADRLRRARVPVVIDHMGRAPARLGAHHEGLRTLVRLMREGPVWVKLSGVANISDEAPNYGDARAVHEVLVDAAPERLVWGSDWPHTKPGSVPPDTPSLLQLFRAWTPNELHDRLLWRNAMALYRL